LINGNRRSAGVAATKKTNDCRHFKTGPVPDSVSTPARRRNLAREVLLALRAEIISDKLQPGDAIS
jgi:hypothetical protein